jgi:hypothetical protein
MLVVLWTSLDIYAGEPGTTQNPYGNASQGGGQEKAATTTSSDPPNSNMMIIAWWHAYLLVNYKPFLQSPRILMSPYVRMQGRRVSSALITGPWILMMQYFQHSIWLIKSRSVAHGLMLNFVDALCGN